MSGPDKTEKKITDPTEFYGRPEEVLTDAELTSQEKRRVLESWKLEAMRLSGSTDENMPGGEDHQLQAVNDALLALREDEAREAG